MFETQLTIEPTVMTEVLVLTERVRNTIALGENHFREFKSALDGPPGMKKRRPVRNIAQDIAEALVGFANADGGEILVGVEDDGSVTGVSHGEPELRLLMNAPSTHILKGQVLPILNSASLQLDGKIVLFFSVAKGATEIYQLADGTCKRRVEKETLPASATQIHFERAEVRSREYDRQFIDGASINDLDIGAVQIAAEQFIKGIGIERYLQQIGLAEYTSGALRLRRAALLLYAVQIDRWQPHSQVRVLRVDGNELKSGESYNVVQDEVVVGNIFDLLTRAWQTLRPFLAYKTEFGANAKFEQKYIYPELACQEALINAIAHRDYVSSTGIEVFIFDDRLEIKNPGQLLSNLSIPMLRQLGGAHESRNSLVSKVLRENNRVMRELGEGMRRMFELMFDSELEEPKLSSTAGSFTITLSSKSSFSSHQEQWLLMFQQFELTTLQKRILVLGMDDREIAPNDIYSAMGTDDRNTYDREVTSLRVADLLIQTRSTQSASTLARSKRIPKANIARFKVQIPGLPVRSRSISLPVSISAAATERVNEKTSHSKSLRAAERKGSQVGRTSANVALRVEGVGVDTTPTKLRTVLEPAVTFVQSRRVGKGTYLLKFVSQDDARKAFELLNQDSTLSMTLNLSLSKWPL